MSTLASSARCHGEFRRYFEGVDAGTALTLTQPQAFGRPIPLRNLRARPNGFRPPQGFAYVDPRTSRQLLKAAAWAPRRLGGERKPAVLVDHAAEEMRCARAAVRIQRG
ncbi:MAG: hypothetical protein F4017_11710 [Acidimicrobiaceae bacterium]|nr:hypothetical protein [Acidimicrobiaceae bacterium]